MERYAVTFADGEGKETRLLIPFRSSAPVADLTVEIWRRLNRVGINVGKNDLELRLGGVDGPIVFEDDALEHVIFNTKDEQLYVVNKPTISENLKPNMGTATINLKRNNPLNLPVNPFGPHQTLSPAERPIKVRVITTALAYTCRSLAQIPPLESNFSRTSTLNQLREEISNHLSIQLPNSVPSRLLTSNVCNCPFARTIGSNGQFNIGDIQNLETSHSDQHPYLLIHSNNVVEIKYDQNVEEQPLKQSVHNMIQNDAFNDIEVDSSTITYFSSTGIDTGGDSQSQIVPSITVCSRTSEEHVEQTSAIRPIHQLEPVDGVDAGSKSREKYVHLDLHVSETPISTERGDLTLEQLGLCDLANEGILNIFAVVWRSDSTSQNRPSGREGIYAFDDCWQPKVEQSERGRAMFLSSLRVFVSLLYDNALIQDSILHILHLLTDFPPALRTMYILISGKSPTREECAALCQALFESIKGVVPLDGIGLGDDRIFEGSRLFFGLILDKSHTFKLGEEAILPYLTAMKSLSLMNSETFGRFINPVDTNVGLLEKGCFDALKAGIIKYSNSELSEITETPLDGRTRRAAVLCPNTSDVLSFDMNMLYTTETFESYRKYSQIFPDREWNDLNNLAVLCLQHNLSIVSPERLTSAPDNVLTLDRDGFGAVYVGRQPCSNPGQDFLIFRPTRGGDTPIDIAVVAQLLKPILERRDADGTAILDSIGSAIRRKLETPDELLMICVDCSQSMRGSACFEDVNPDDGELFNSPVNDTTLAEVDNSPPGSLEDIKEELCEHESFDDIVQTVKVTRSSKQARMALDLLDQLLELKECELRHWREKLSELRRRIFWSSRRAEQTRCEEKISSIRKSIVETSFHKQALADFIVFRAGYRGERATNSPWYWLQGDTIPAGPNLSNITYLSTNLNLEVPEDYLCPMTHELFNDPVTAPDGHTYDRAAIYRWFQVRSTSPMTGLILNSTNLTTNRVMTRNVREWIAADNIINSSRRPRLEPSATTTSSSRRRSQRHSTQSSYNTNSIRNIKIKFISFQGEFEQYFYQSTSVSTLYDVAFRGLKGRHSDFSLHFRGQALLPDERSLSQRNIQDGSVIDIILAPSQFDSSSSSLERGDGRCLIKVFSSAETLFFAFWTSRNTKSSVSSLIFKFWCFKAEKGHCNPTKMDIRYNYKSLGDGWRTTKTISPWDDLSKYLNTALATGILGEETMFPKENDLNPFGSLSITSNTDRETTTTPLVFKVTISNSEKRLNKSSRKAEVSRLSVLKQMFDQFVNRILAYNYKTHIGLITFSNTASVGQSLTHIVEDFRNTVNRLEHNGDTALWDALAMANEQIMTYAEQYPDAKRRILCISDGDDTKSTRTAGDVCNLLSQNNIFVDSFVIGNEEVSALRAMSYVTKGYNFHPKTLEDSMAICELEPILSLSERDIDSVIASRRQDLIGARLTSILQFSIARQVARPETVTRDVFPKRKEHPNLNNDFIPVSSAAPRRVLPARERVGAGLRNTRLLTEVQSASSNRHPHYEIFVSEQDMSFWKIVMQGPPESIYSTGTFLLYLHMEEDYPSFSPKCRFITPIYHPNVNRHGRICHSIFDRNWTTDTSNGMILSTIYGLLYQPDYTDPVNVVGTLHFYNDQVAFAEQARESIRRHASKSREAWRADILETRVPPAEYYHDDAVDDDLYA